MRKAFSYAYEGLKSFPNPCRKDGAGTVSPTLQRALTQAYTKLNESQSFDEGVRKGKQDLILVGIDEVGRGPLAGPLVAACCAFSAPLPCLPFVRDSKKLSEDERYALAPLIKKAAAGFGYGIVQPSEFDLDLNLHQLVFLAMLKALKNAGFKPEQTMVIIDGKFTLPKIEWPGQQQAVVGGDDLSFSVSAASILAKVYRDELMLEIDKHYPAYGFSNNKGYGTAQHRAAIIECGPCPMHRKNFLRSILNTA